MKTDYTVQPAAPADWYQQVPELHPVIAQILYNADIRTAEAAQHWLHPDYALDQHDPFLFADMQKVVERLVRARDNGESVLVYGDYDADGVCSSVLLYTALQQIGVQKLQIYLPHRDTEGYGLNAPAVEKFAEENVDLIITVDCGISNAAEVQQAADLGIDVIVTDHHVEPVQLPTAAYAIINPQVKACHYPFAMLAGVGVAFKVAQALRRHLKLDEGFEKWLLDLVAISTITDCMPLRDENRTLVKYGLVVLNKTKRLGLQKLITATHKPDVPVTTIGIGYRLGPWINAAGRIDHANMAVKLLLAEDAATADDSVQKLADANTSRQDQTETMFQEARAEASTQTDQPVIYVYGSHWPVGLIGLVAGKLVSEFHKPTFVMTENKGEVFGSGRSVEGVNLIATLQKLDGLFARYGGHAMACGFSLKTTTSRDQFAQAFTSMAAEALAKCDPVKRVTVAAVVTLKDITWQFIEQLDALQPWGEKNPEPLFKLDQVTIKDFQTVGATQKHLRLVFTDESGAIVKAIAFGMGDKAEALSLGAKLSVICNLGVNQWNGNKEIQLMVKELL